MSRWVQHAVDSLKTALDNGIAAQLAIIETEESLSAGTLEVPGRSTKSRVPYDSAHPVTQMVFDLQWEFAQRGGQRNRLMRIDCMVAIARQGTSDYDENETRARQYQSAVIETIIADPTLGGQVINAVITAGDAGIETSGKRVTQTVSTVTVQVTVGS